MKTIGEAYQFTINVLSKEFGQREGARIARYVFEDIYELHRFPSDHRFDQHTQLESIIQRLLDHEPVQYITGRADFYGLALKVNASVLIPRPETEELVEWTLQTAKKERNLKILDIGTGSGCIAAALKKHLPHAEVWGLDISEQALELARENAFRHHLDITFRKQDILNELKWETLPRFDIIVSNPPYITQEESVGMEDNVVAYEPGLALFVDDDDPLQFYRVITAFAQARLKPGGYLFFEINAYLGQQTMALLKQGAWREVVLQKDLQGRDRMIRVSNTKE